MGPIRTFLRPSHAVAPDLSSSTAGLFCSTQSFPTQHHHHRPCCVHVTTQSLSQHHSQHHTLYGTADPLRVGLMSPTSHSPHHSQTPTPSPPAHPSLYHQFKKLLPPKSSPLGHSNNTPTYSGLDSFKVYQREADSEKKRKDRWGSTNQWVSSWNLNERDFNCDASGQKAEANTLLGLDKNKTGNSEVKTTTTSVETKWKTSNKQLKGRGGSNIHPVIQERKVEKLEARKKRDNEYRDRVEDKSNISLENKASKLQKISQTKTSSCSSYSSSFPLSKHHDESLASSSHMTLTFPFSEDEDDDEDGDDNYKEGRVALGEGSRRMTWTISDIVETEDEESDINLQNQTQELTFKSTNEYNERFTNINEYDTYKVKNENYTSKGLPRNTVVVEKNTTLQDEVIKNDEDEYEREKMYFSVKENYLKKEENKFKEQSTLYDSGSKKNNSVSVVTRTPSHSSHFREIPQDNKKQNRYISGCSLKDNSKNLKTELNTSVRNPNINSDEEIHTDFDKNDTDAEDSPINTDNEDDINEQETQKQQNEGVEEELNSSQSTGIRSTQRLRPRSYRQFLLTRERRSRVFLKERSYHLGRWFVGHFSHPYPSKEQKDVLASKTNMTKNQVSEWFGNMRRRIREATRGLSICWEERVRIYNSVITGKSEPLPILPEDEINSWVPPVSSQDVTVHEEVSASPKFKTALMHRYLSNPKDTQNMNDNDEGDSTKNATDISKIEFVSGIGTSKINYRKYHSEEDGGSKGESSGRNYAANNLNKSYQSLTLYSLTANEDNQLSKYASGSNISINSICSSGYSSGSISSNNSISSTSDLRYTSNISNISSNMSLHNSCSNNFIGVRSSQILVPISTSTPKAPLKSSSIKELWNSTFEQIKDNYRPSAIVSPRLTNAGGSKEYQKELQESSAINNTIGYVNVQHAQNAKIPRKCESTDLPEEGSILLSSPSVSKKARIIMGAAPATIGQSALELQSQNKSLSYSLAPTTVIKSLDSGFSSKKSTEKEDKQDAGRKNIFKRIIQGHPSPKGHSSSAWTLHQSFLSNKGSNFGEKKSKGCSNSTTPTTDNNSQGETNSHQPEELAAAYTLMQLHSVE